jgi:hypothetical protein
MSESTMAGATLCLHCGHAAAGMSGGCPHCGSPLATTAGPAASGAALSAARPADRPAVPATAAGVLPFRFEPARIASGPRLSRKTWRVIAASGAALALAVAAFVVLRPAPPSPAGAVRDYFADLGRDDAAAALALVDTLGGDISSMPLLTPAALAAAANRPTGATVNSSRTETAASGIRYAEVTATYEVGGQPVRQVFDVVATADKDTPYRLEQPFLYLTVEAPAGLAATVNGIAVDADTLARGTPAFPGTYQATTAGNGLFAGDTQAATYQADEQGVAADIRFGAPALAPEAASTVQAATQAYLDTYCVNPPADSYGYPCPMSAPYMSYDQTTTWTITTYPQVQLSPPDPNQNAVRFATGTAGSADYRITYDDYNGARTESGTVPIDIDGIAQTADDGTVQITLGQ